jgi:predicted CxxxxCH...CXXCH cytochrome family protein
VSCHDHTKSFQGGCTGCHGNTTTGNWWPDGTAEHGTAHPNRPGDHQQHIDALAAANGWTTTSQKNGSCDTCHPNPGGGNHNVNTTGSLANTADVHGDPQNLGTNFKSILGAANGVAGTYNNVLTANGKRCSNTDCHYRTPTPVTGTATANGDGWFQPLAAASCSNCHSDVATYASGALPRAHDVHVGGAGIGKGFACSSCHTVPSPVDNMSHQNGRVGVSLSSSLGEPSGGAAAASGSDNLVKFAGSGSFATCSSVYCHGDFAGGNVASPKWDNALTGNCGTCHNQTQMASGNHLAHTDNVWGPQITCDGCHPSYGVSSAYHVNNVKELANLNVTTSPVATLGATVPPVPPPATNTDRCNNCHSTATAVGQASSGVVLAKTNWGTAAYRLACVTCHNASSPAWDNVTGVGVQAPGKDARWAVSGHGLASGSYTTTGNAAANLSCGTCHNETSSHISHVLDDSDRLKSARADASTYVDNTSEFCMDCHATGLGAGNLGVNATSKASVHSGGVNNKYNTSVLAPTAFPAYGNVASYAASPGYQCAACHDVHGTTKVAMILGTVNGLLGSPAQSNPVTVGAGLDYATAGPTTLNNLDPTVAVNDGVCDACHRSTGTTTPHPDSAHAGNHNQGQNCVSCHDHTKSFQGGCTGCHGNTTTGNWWPDGTAEHGTAHPNRPGDHQQHIDALAAANGWTTTSQKNGSCDTCHPNPGGGNHNVNTTGSLANTADVHGDPQNLGTNFKSILGAANGVAGTYNNVLTANGKRCSNTDCHYRTPTPVTGTATANGDGWFQPLAAASCSNCHSDVATYASGALPRAHDVHVGGAGIGKGFACSSCHTVPSPVDNMSHQNGRVGVSLSSSLGEPSGGAAAASGSDNLVKFAGSGSFATCSSVYCHGDFAGGNVASPKWDNALTGNCGTCHNQTQMASGNHLAHTDNVWGPQITCDGCHPSYGVSSAYHVNNVKELANLNVTTSPVATLGATVPPVPPPATNTDRCNNCHSTATAVGQASSGVVLAKTNWGTAAYRLACVTCHNASSPAWDNVTGVGVQAPGKDARWAVSGHGLASGSYTTTGNAAANLSCGTCHNETSSHISHVLDDSDRLKSARADASTYVDNTSEFCMDCHATGLGAGNLGVNATSKASVHSGGVNNKYNTSVLAPTAFPAYGNVASYAASPGYQCAACHDVHGTTKVAMILGTVNGLLGSPAQSNPVTVGAGLDYATAGPTTLNNLDPTVAVNDGVCDACHRSTGTTTPHPDSAHAGNHNQGQNCVSCHDHTKSFQGGCTGCHGNTTTGNWWPDGTAEHGTAHPNRPGDHQQHIDALAAANGWTTTSQKNGSCDTCHPNPGGGNHNVNTTGSLANTADVHGDPQNLGTNFKSILGAANGVAGTYNNVLTANGKRCSNTDCHYRTPTPVTGTATANGDGWFQPLAAASCSNCHSDVATYASGALPRAHDVHVGGAGIGKGFACSSCHTVPSPVDNMSHQNGRVGVSLSSSLGEPSGGAAAASGSDNLVKFAGSGSFATCSSVYCHGDFAGGNVASPKWDNALTGNCGTCHNQTQMASGNHLAHTDNVWGPQITCDGCHPSYGVSSAYHVNNVKELANLNVTTSPVATLGATVPPVPPPATNTDRCNNCHSTATAVGQASSGVVLAKTNWGTAAYRLACVTCHNASSPAWDNVTGVGVQAPGKDARWAVSGHGLASGSYTTTGNAAANLSCGTCHNETSSHISHVLDDSDRLKSARADASTYVDNTSEFCMDCHATGLGAGNLGVNATSKASVHSGGVNNKYNTSVLAPTAFPAYGNVASYAASPGYQCAACHDVHGTTKVAMILGTVNGLLGSPAQSNPVTVGAGLDYATAGPTTLNNLDPTVAVNDGVCDACHRSTGTTTPHPDSAHAGNHNQGQNCVSCHDHTKSFQASCTGCHGNDTTGEVWPDGIANNPTRSAYADDAGAHLKHVNAIAGARGWTTTSQKNTSCDVCHPGNPPAGHSTDTTTGATQAEVTRMDTTGNGYVGPPTVGDYWSYAGSATATSGTAVYFKTMAGANDANGYIDNTLKSCSNIDCHGGTTTPAWYGDTSPPVFSPNNVITVTNPASDGELSIGWPTATDAGTPPVRYDLYRQAGPCRTPASPAR